MTGSRFWLERSRAHPTIVYLHVQETGVPRKRAKGFCMTVNSRADAKAQLAHMRAALASYTERAQPTTRFYDPAEAT